LTLRRFDLTAICLLLYLGLTTSAYAQSSAITSIAPNSASFGESVTITGIGFGGPGVQIRVNGVPAPLVSGTGRRATFLVPVGINTGPAIVTATNPGGHTGSIAFNVSGVVTLSLDEANASQATIGPSGGVVTATAGGRTYQLTIPAGALASDEVIVLTPITTISGLPLDSLLAAVHFAPEGLQFFKAATLRIELPPTANTHNLIALAGDGNGDNLHLTPLRLDHGVLVPVTHFSTDTVGTASSIAVQHVPPCTNATIECTYLNELAIKWHEAEQNICGSDCSTEADFESKQPDINNADEQADLAVFQQWFGAVLPVMNGDGLSSDAGLKTAGREFMAWRGWVNASSCPAVPFCSDDQGLAEDIATGTDALAAGYLAAIQRAHSDCNDHRVADLIAEIDSFGLLGKGELPNDDNALRDQFACQLVLGDTLPSSVKSGDTVTFAATVGLRTGGPDGLVVPLPEADVTIIVSSGCGTFVNGGTRTVAGQTDATGVLSESIRFPCSGSTEITVVAADVFDANGGLVALGHRIVAVASVSSSTITTISVTPENATVVAGGAVQYSAHADGGSGLFTWTATGGSFPRVPRHQQRSPPGPRRGCSASRRRASTIRRSRRRLL